MLTLPGEAQSNCHVSSMGGKAAVQALAQLQGSFVGSSVPHQGGSHEGVHQGGEASQGFLRENQVAGNGGCQGCQANIQASSDGHDALSNLHTISVKSVLDENLCWDALGFLSEGQIAGNGGCQGCQAHIQTSSDDEPCCALKSAHQLLSVVCKVTIIGVTSASSGMP